MPVARDIVAYTSVAVGVAIAAALIRWMPVVPASRAAPVSAAPRSSLLNLPVPPPPPPLSESAPPSRPRTIPQLTRPQQPAAPVIERRVSTTPAAPASSPKIRPARRKPPVAAVSPAPDTAGPPPAPERPPILIEVPVPTVAPAPPAPVGIRARIGDVAAFKTKVLDLASQFSGSIIFRENLIRIELPADRRPALKSELDRIILGYLSDDGVEMRIELIGR